MKSCIETVRFTFKLSLLFGVITYLVTVNIETNFLSLNTIWISNNFVLTVCGGIVASFLVVLLSEIQKYFSAKISSESYLFYHATYLYSALFLMQQNILEYTKNTDEVIPENLLEMRTQMAQSELFALQNMEYVTFRDKSPLAIAHHNFCTETAAKVKSVSDSSINLRIAINIAKTDNLKYYQEARDITSANKTVCSTLIILYRNITSVLKEIDKYLLTIDHSCENRFNWTIMRTTIQENYVSIFKAGNFEDFLKQGE